MRKPKMGSKIGFMLGALAALAPSTFFSSEKAVQKEWKPEFSKAELEHLRSLPKKEKKRAVEELRQKYRHKNQNEGWMK